jgi:hypothetical protein
VDENLQGAVVKQYPLSANSSTIDNAIASLPNNESVLLTPPCSETYTPISFLYVLSASAKSIDVLALNSPGGATKVQTFNFDSALKARGVTIDANRLQGMAVFMKGQ